MTKHILVTGAGGQLGSELVALLAARYGEERIVTSDVRPLAQVGSLRYENLDVLDFHAIEHMIREYDVGQIYHLAASLSAVAEQKPKMAWSLNMGGLLNVLEAARKHKVGKIFWPSSIGVFGISTPADNTPQQTLMEPDTVYGISKLAGEGWCRWYRQQTGLDVRSLRYPGLISYKVPPGGGTTDYAIDIFHAACSRKPYICPLEPDMTLPMMYMPDALRATVELMEAPRRCLGVTGSYNLTAMSFTPAQLAAEICRHIPDFSIFYQPDARQKIAAGWPNSIDDTAAQRDWGWLAEFGLTEMVADMITNLENAK